MLVKQRTLNFFSHLRSQGSTKACCTLLSNGGMYYLLRNFCDMVEQAEIPCWVKLPQGARPLLSYPDDDFILPSLANGGKIQMGHDQDKRSGKVCGEIVDNVDKISWILISNKYDSSEAVVRAMDSCGVTVLESTVVDKLLKRFSNDWIPAFGFFRWADMQTGYNLSVDAYNLMVDILGKAKQFDIMWILVEELIRRGNLVSLVTMSKIMRRLARAGLYMDAIDTFNRIERFGLRKDTPCMNALLDALCKEQSVEHANDVFLELKSKIPPDAHSFNILIHGWSKARKFDEAYVTMDEMRYHGFHPHIISYTSLIEAYCKDKNFRKVNSLLDEMQANQCLPNVVTYTIIMHALGKAKQTCEALEIFERMKKDGCTPDASFYNSVIYILGKAGRVQDVHEIFKEMCSNGIRPDVTTYNTIISCACDHSQEEQAMVYLRKMAENSCKPDIKTYAPLLKMCCKKQRMKSLQFLLKDMFENDISLDRGTYTLLANSLCRNGKLELSCMYFEEMILKGFLPSHHTYNLLEEELERKNMRKEKKRIQELISVLKARILLY